MPAQRHAAQDGAGAFGLGECLLEEDAHRFQPEHPEADERPPPEVGVIARLQRKFSEADRVVLLRTETNYNRFLLWMNLSPVQTASSTMQMRNSPM